MFAYRFARPRQALAMAVGSLLASACLVGTAQTEGALEPCADAQALQQAVQRLNELRQQADAPCAVDHIAQQPLAWESRLAASALEQASDLAQRDLLSHVDSHQRGLGARLRHAGYAAAGAGENLAAGQADFDDTLQAWLASPSHCINLMKPEYRDVGLACVQRRGSHYERFWVAHLATSVQP
jgi:uncharacterized protein YkwD